MSIKRFAVKALPILVGGLFAGHAGAAGFQLLEQNAAGIGNAYAGTAALAEDASTVYWNPAGMSMLKGRTVTFGVDAVKPTAKFSNSGTLAPAGIGSVGGNGGDAGDWAAIPFGYFVMPLTDRISVGVGMSGPFGLTTEYDNGWAGRFYAVKSAVETININPSISFKLNDQFSLGIGANFQKIDAELTNQVDYFAALAQAAGPAAAAALLPNQAQREGLAKIEGDDTAWGWNIGALWQVSPTTRLGVAYRSSIKYEVEGTVSFANRPAQLGAALADGGVKGKLEVPDSATLSVYQVLNDRWEMMGDVSWTGWSKIQNLTFNRTSAGATLPGERLGWRDTMRVALGANYKYSDQWKLRMGLAWDQSPVQDSTRLPRLPDSDRIWLAFGAQYRLSPASTIDFGYSHIFIDDGSISTSTEPAAAGGKGVLRGNYNNSVDLLGAQFSMRF